MLQKLIELLDDPTADEYDVIDLARKIKESLPDKDTRKPMELAFDDFLNCPHAEEYGVLQAHMFIYQQDVAGQV